MNTSNSPKELQVWPGTDVYAVIPRHKRLLNDDNVDLLWASIFKDPLGTKTIVVGVSSSQVEANQTMAQAQRDVLSMLRPETPERIREQILNAHSICQVWELNGNDNIEYQNQDPYVFVNRFGGRDVHYVEKQGYFYLDLVSNEILIKHYRQVDNARASGVEMNIGDGPFKARASIPRGVSVLVETVRGSVSLVTYTSPTGDLIEEWDEFRDMGWDEAEKLIEDKVRGLPEMVDGVMFDGPEREGILQ